MWLSSPTQWTEEESSLCPSFWDSFYQSDPIFTWLLASDWSWLLDNNWSFWLLILWWYHMQRASLQRESRVTSIRCNKMHAKNRIFRRSFRQLSYRVIKFWFTIYLKGLCAKEDSKPLLARRLRWSSHLLDKDYPCSLCEFAWYCPHNYGRWLRSRILWGGSASFWLGFKAECGS